MSRQGCVVVISGPSGVGKGTLLKKYLDEHKNCYISISATTREPRTGEQNGVSYHFITKAEFMQLIDTGEILEHNKYGENFYGTLKKPIETAVASGKLAILEIDVNGFMQVRDKLPNILSIFIAPPSVAVLKERLLQRGTEAQEQIDSRIKISEKEQQYMEHYDTVIVNDILDDAYNELCTAIDKKLCALQ